MGRIWVANAVNNVHVKDKWTAIGRPYVVTTGAYALRTHFTHMLDFRPIFDNTYCTIAWQHRIKKTEKATKLIKSSRINS